MRATLADFAKSHWTLQEVAQIEAVRDRLPDHRLRWLHESRRLVPTRNTTELLQYLARNPRPARKAA